MKNNNIDMSSFIQGVKSIEESTETIHTAISKSIQPLVNLSKSIREHFKRPEIQESLTRIAEGFIETKEDIKNYKKVIFLMGYPPSESTDILLMRQIGREYVENGESNLKSIIDDIMKDHYNAQRIDEIKRHWENYSLLKERLPLLRQSLNAHNLGMFAISVPSILSQMEGIVIDGFDIKQRVTGSKFKKLLKILFNIEDDEDSKGDENPFNFDNIIGKFYLNFILEQFQHGQENLSDVSRHAILHGGAKPTMYAKEEISLKMIMMMDNLLYRINNLTQEKKNEAHVILS
ncbi:hypothetical protein MX663_11305 [Bacillus subtilis]|uniref:hypothetical protein n=1 Tax=Bacillus subtilis TaxID=1423 RepID=UPI001FFB04F4|nr:hypothetical protein [Bacillus subtilis]UPG79712.1 hypothetical protein MX663_11305 [Bacillus subtilis]